MKFFNLIKAFFTVRGKEEEIELYGAEVRKDGVYLHPTEDPDRIIFMKTDAVDIIINPGKEIDEDDIIYLEKKKNENKPAEKDRTKEADHKKWSDGKSGVTRASLNRFMPAKKRFSILLYPDEYEMLTNNIKENGYKKAEYLLACMTSVKKNSMEATYKRYYNEHKYRHEMEIAEAKRAQEEDYQTRMLAQGTISTGSKTEEQS